VKAVVFDVGETLVNEARWWAELGQVVGLEPHVVWAAVGAVVERGERPAHAWRLLGVDHPGREVVGFEGADLYPDARPCLERIRTAGYAIGLAGNVGRAIEPFVERFALDVDFALASHTLGVEKPSPEFFARVAERVGCPPGEIAYIGDRIDNDVRPARDAGMVAVHIRRGPWGYLQDGAEAADIRIQSLAELPGAFERV
jgi:HAD superfamily hydrolase (TIGR01549 family)